MPAWAVTSVKVMSDGAAAVAAARRRPATAPAADRGRLSRRFAAIMAVDAGPHGSRFAAAVAAARRRSTRAPAADRGRLTRRFAAMMALAAARSWPARVGRRKRLPHKIV